MFSQLAPNEVRCDGCGQAISQYAKRCPSCGQKMGISVIKTILGIIAFILALYFIISGIFS